MIASPKAILVKRGANGVETRALRSDEIIYPDSDGQPMAENTLQFEWITVLKEGFEALFFDREDVFVAGDLLWYPVEGRVEIRLAPDVMIAFGRPKGYRGSYKAWEEAGVSPQVVWEIVSPGNSLEELTAKKLQFYERYGVLEYYIYNPDPEKRYFLAWQRASVAEPLKSLDVTTTIFSPQTGVRINGTVGELIVLRPDGEPFKNFVLLMRERNAEHRRAEEAELRAESAENEIERLRALLRQNGLSFNGSEP